MQVLDASLMKFSIGYGRLKTSFTLKTTFTPAFGFRAKWLFKPKVSPDRMPKLKEVASVSELGSTHQFQWTPQKASSFQYEMQDGVVTVWQDEGKSESLFQIPGTAFDFFSDMHR